MLAKNRLLENVQSSFPTELRGLQQHAGWLAGWGKTLSVGKSACVFIYIAMYKSTWNLDLNVMLYVLVYHHQSFSAVSFPSRPLLFFPLPFSSLPFLCYHGCWCRWWFLSNYSRADRSLILPWPPSTTSSIPHNVLHSPFILHSFSNLHWVGWTIWRMPFLHRDGNPAFTIETIKHHKNIWPTS